MHLSWAQSHGCLQVWHLMAWLGSVESALEKAPPEIFGPQDLPPSPKVAPALQMPGPR